MVEQNKEIYYNEPQLIFARCNPTTAYLPWARGTGKTEGPFGFRMYNVITKMPRSNNALVVPSYQKFLKDLLPAIRKALKLYGLREYDPHYPANGGHYVIGIKPPKHWPSPIYEPESYTAVMTFCTGAIYALFSQDSKTKNQGNSLVSVIGDEAKLLDHARIREDVLKAMRGGAEWWGHLPEFNSELYLSDKFLTEKSNDWFIEAKKRANIDDINTFIKCALREPFMDAVELKSLDFVRKNIFFYFEASGYDNRHSLGLKYFQRAFENSSPLEFLVSHLNYDMDRVESSFYRLLDSIKHGYFASSQSYYENLEYKAELIEKANCLGDTDINVIYPLEISFDFGGKNNGCTVHQYDDIQHIEYLLKDFAIQGKLSDLVDDIDAYYQPHKKRNCDIKLWCDASGTNEVANSNLSYLDEIESLFIKKGWNVISKQKESNYINHNEKYLIWENILNESPERDNTWPRFRYNRNNASRTAFSMGMAPQIKTNGQIKKDKSSEKKRSTPWEKATHLSDCADNPICFKWKSLLKKTTNWI